MVTVFMSLESGSWQSRFDRQAQFLGVRKALANETLLIRCIKMTKCQDLPSKKVYLFNQGIERRKSFT